MDNLENLNPEGDEETQKILDEMSNQSNQDKTDEKPETPEEAPEEKPKEETPETPETPEEPEDPEEKSEEKQEKRNVSYMPISKYKSQKDKWTAEKAELQQKIDELSKSKGEGQKPNLELDEQIKSLAEKHQLDPTILSELSTVIASKVKLPPETERLIEDLRKKENQIFQAEEMEKEFNGFIAKTINEDEKKRILALKEEIKTLAQTNEFKLTPLRTIFLHLEDQNVKPKGKKTAESSRPKSQSEKYVDFEKADNDPELISKMSDKEFEKFSQWKADTSPGKYKLGSSLKNRQR